MTRIKSYCFDSYNWETWGIPAGKWEDFIILRAAGTVFDCEWCCRWQESGSTAQCYRCQDIQFTMWPTITANPKDKSFAQFSEALKNHFEHKPMVIAERFTFYCRDQYPNESILEYVAELRVFTVNSKGSWIRLWEIDWYVGWNTKAFTDAYLLRQNSHSLASTRDGGSSAKCWINERKTDNRR